MFYVCHYKNCKSEGMRSNSKNYIFFKFIKEIRFLILGILAHVFSILPRILR